MCMITYIPGGVAIPWIGIYNGATWNEDGQGWACATPDGIFMGKSFSVDDSLDALYEVRRQYPSCPALFHSRWATHGELSDRNIHPFFVGKRQDTVLAHNGILPTAFHPKGKNWRSDTNIFAQWLGRHENILSRRGRQVIGEMIGSYNKLVILTNSPVYDKPRGFIVNAKAGDWDEGCWFSNYDYCTSWKYKKPTTTNQGQSWLWDGIDSGESEGKTGSGTGYSSIRVIGGKSISDMKAIVEAAILEPECPACKRRGGVEPEANVCLSCDYCLDCMSPMSSCLCYWGGRGRELTTSEKDSGWMNQDGVES